MIGPAEESKEYKSPEFANNDKINKVEEYES
jgi:hypothetical protein